MMRTKSSIVWVGLWFLGLLGPLWAAEVLTYPRPVSDADHRSEYPLRMLELALQKSGHSYKLRPSDLVMNKARVASELLQGKIDVAWMVTSMEREENLRPIRICIFKGLGGWRVALINQGDEARFAKVKSLADLQQLHAGQQEDWPDTAILRNSGIPVETTASYDPLFKMLQAHRFDWFPRNIMEIWAEAETYKKQGLVVEPTLLIRYPSAYYFFVNKKSPALAEQIEKGLEKALKDGSFDNLLREYHGDVIERAHIKSRRVIDLPNPMLPPATPLKRKELWFQIKDAS